MGISAKDRKILWTKAGNQCAFPGCRQLLIVSDHEAQPDTVIGEEAHIVSKKRIGPRGHEISNSMDSYDNIVLLCPTHHTLIDAQPEIYTKEALIDIKRAHEQRIRNKIVSSEYGWLVGNSHVVLDIYGVQPVWCNDHWRACGLRIGQTQINHTSEETYWFFESSEAEYDVKYWICDPIFYVEQSVFLYVERCFKPFVRHEFDLSSIPAPSNIILLMEIDQTLAAQIPNLTRRIKSFDEGDSIDDLCILLSRLWRTGLYDPVQVCRELQQFQRLWWHDGEMAELISSMKEELNLVQKAKFSHE